MKFRQGLTTAVLGVTAAIIVSACNDGGAGTGSLSMSITDAAVDDLTKVNVQFTGISVKHENESPRRVDFEEPRDIDLLSLQGAISESLFTDETVTAGRYQWVRLHVNAEDGNEKLNYVETTNQETHPLFVPSGTQSGLKLVSGFNVPRNGSADFTIDFDLRKSVVKRGKNNADYILKPALRIIDNSTVGHIAGSVDLTAQGCSPDDSKAVYVYEGHDATLYDIDIREESENPDPVTSANVTWNDQDDAYTYTAGFLTAGNYTIALTCTAEQDDPEANDMDNDAFELKAPQNVEVMADHTTTANF